MVSKFPLWIFALFLQLMRKLLHWFTRRKQCKISFRRFVWARSCWNCVWLLHTCFRIHGCGCCKYFLYPWLGSTSEWWRPAVCFLRFHFRSFLGLFCHPICWMYTSRWRCIAESTTSLCRSNKKKLKGVERRHRRRTAVSTMNSRWSAKTVLFKCFRMVVVFAPPKYCTRIQRGTMNTTTTRNKEFILEHGRSKCAPHCTDVRNCDVATKKKLNRRRSKHYLSQTRFFLLMCCVKWFRYLWLVPLKKTIHVPCIMLMWNSKGHFATTKEKLQSFEPQQIVADTTNRG